MLLTALLHPQFRRYQESLLGSVLEMGMRGTEEVASIHAPTAHSLLPDTDVKLAIILGSKGGSWNISNGWGAGISHPSNKRPEESGKLRREFDSGFRGQ